MTQEKNINNSQKQPVIEQKKMKVVLENVRTGKTREVEMTWNEIEEFMDNYSDFFKEQISNALTSINQLNKKEPS